MDLSCGGWGVRDLAQEVQGFSRAVVFDNSHHVRTASSRRRVGDDPDTKRCIRHEGDLLGEREGDVVQLILKEPIDHGVGQAGAKVLTRVCGEVVDQVLDDGAADGYISFREDGEERGKFVADASLC